MIVVDASVLVEVLLQTDTGLKVEAKLFGSGRSLHAPHLVDVEIAHALRRLAAAGDFNGERGGEMLAELSKMRIRRYGHGSLMQRAWDLRSNVTAYDAVYVALAEMIDASLLTCDRRLANAAEDLIDVELI